MTPPGLRADAQLNRDRILQVAREALAASPDASLNSIARTAGVGAGTLYRHFPTREDLLLAVYRHDIGRISDSAADLLAQHPPLEAIKTWFLGLADAIRLKHGFPEVFASSTGDDVIRDSYAPVQAAIRTMLAAGERDGTIRPGIEPNDLLILMGFLWRIDASATDQADRMIDLVLAGLQAT